jgi:hypothetical protein
MDSIDDLKAELLALKARNKRVEAEKAWEVSSVRKFTIASATYLIASLLLIAIRNESPWTNALIPAAGYFLSNLSLPFLKKRWMSRYLESHGPS